MSRVARIVIIRDGEGYTTRIVWSRDEWCRRVPRVWLERCGCNRCCDASRIPRGWLDLLDRDGLVLIHYARGETWFVRRDPRNPGRVCLSPWPRNLYATLL